MGERGRQRRFLLCVCVLRALVCCVGMQPCGRCVCGRLGVVRIVVIIIAIIAIYEGGPEGGSIAG